LFARVAVAFPPPQEKCFQICLHRGLPYT
jgi:hypothetical protein